MMAERKADQETREAERKAYEENRRWIPRQQAEGIITIL
jgi:hypothetical protein